MLGHALVLAICVVATIKVSNPDEPGEWRGLVIPFLCVACTAASEILVVVYSLLWSGTLGSLGILFYIAKAAIGLGASWEAFKFYRVGLMSSVAKGQFYLNLLVLNKEEA